LKRAENLYFQAEKALKEKSTNTILEDQRLAQEIIENSIKRK